MVCMTDGDLSQTHPFIPTAVSNGTLVARWLNRGYFGFINLSPSDKHASILFRCMCEQRSEVDDEGDGDRGDLLSTEL